MRPFASLSLDLDNKWSYLKIHGDGAWSAYPSYFDVAVPRFLEFLKQRDLTITVFVVGQDAELPQNGPALRALADAGHEIGNHSFSHEPWTAQAADCRIDDEIARAHVAIQRATGRTPTGFRAPGFARSPATLRALVRHGYRYDASRLSTFIGPLARAYYFRGTSFTREERRQRRLLFGQFRDGFGPNHASVQRTGGAPLVEVPVTTMPVTRVPIHFSYLHYLHAVSRRAAHRYFSAALMLCRALNITPSLLLHPLDFLGADDDEDLRFFPGMNRSSSSRLHVLSELLEIFSKKYRIVTMAEHAAAVLEQGTRCA